eukprot:990884_1
MPASASLARSPCRPCALGEGGSSQRRAHTEARQGVELEDEQPSAWMRVLGSEKETHSPNRVDIRRVSMCGGERVFLPISSENSRGDEIMESLFRRAAGAVLASPAALMPTAFVPSTA